MRKEGGLRSYPLWQTSARSRRSRPRSRARLKPATYRKLFLGAAARHAPPCRPRTGAGAAVVGHPASIPRAKPASGVAVEILDAGEGPLPRERSFSKPLGPAGVRRGGLRPRDGAWMPHPGGSRCGEAGGFAEQRRPSRPATCSSEKGRHAPPCRPRTGAGAAVVGHPASIPRAKPASGVAVEILDAGEGPLPRERSFSKPLGPAGVRRGGLRPRDGAWMPHPGGSRCGEAGGFAEQRRPSRPATCSSEKGRHAPPCRPRTGAGAAVVGHPASDPRAKPALKEVARSAAPRRPAPARASPRLLRPADRNLGARKVSTVRGVHSPGLFLSGSCRRS